MSGDMNNQIRTMMDLDLVKKEFSETTAKYRHRLLLCSGSGCVSPGARKCGMH